jgi:hypothetical protein
VFAVAQATQQQLAHVVLTAPDSCLLDGSLARLQQPSLQRPFQKPLTTTATSTTATAAATAAAVPWALCSSNVAVWSPRRPPRQIVERHLHQDLTELLRAKVSTCRVSCLLDSFLLCRSIRLLYSTKWYLYTDCTLHHASWLVLLRSRVHIAVAPLWHKQS